MQQLYTLLLYLIQPLIWLRLFYRSLKAPNYRKRWAERYGFCAGKVKPDGILIHSVSVGETVAAMPLVRKLQQLYPHLPITITTMTPTGSERVTSTFAKSVSHVYLPYDLPGATKRFLNQLKPKLVIIMETELWPNLIDQLHARRIPLIVANARLSERSAKRYAKLGKAMQRLLQRVSLVAAQNSVDGQRFIDLGLPPAQLEITGSLKFDISISEQLATKAHALHQLWAGNRPVWIAASTHHGEDAILLDAHRQLLNDFPDLLLILVPRHPERFASVAKLAQNKGFTCVLRSAGKNPSAKTQVIIGDTMGELMLLYGVADLAFVGGSLVAHGGQNPLEPALHGIPIIMGPHRFNFKEICQKLEHAGCLLSATDSSSLYHTINPLLNNKIYCRKIGQQGANVVSDNQGALDKLLKLIQRYLPIHGELKK